MVNLEKKLTNDIKNKLLLLHGTLKMSEISEITNINIRTIRHFYHKYRLKLSKDEKQNILSRRNKKYNCNDYFFSISTIKSNYWAGFIAADGCITNNRLQIKLKSSDVSHLESFKRDIESNCSILFYNGYRNEKLFKSSLIYIVSPIIIKDLKVKYNITNKKSLTLIQPNIINDFEIDSFIKGYFDGDGTVYFKKNYLCCRFYGTKEINKWIKDRVDSLYGKNSGSIFKKDNIYCYELNPKATIFFGEYFSKINTPELFRKWNIFKEHKKSKRLIIIESDQQEEGETNLEDNQDES